MNADILTLHDTDTEYAGTPLELLLEAYGLSGEHERLADATPYARDAMELVDILGVMARMGYSCAPLNIRTYDLDARLLPCAFVEEKTGQLRILTHVPSESIRGTAYIFTKHEAQDPREQKEALAATGHGWFAQTLLRFRKLAWRVVGLSLLLSVVALALPLFLMAIYDRTADITTPQAIYLLGTGAIIALVIESILRRMRSENLAWFASRIDNIVSNRVLSRLLQMPAYAIERASVASQLARLRSFESVREFATGPLFLTLLDVPFTCIAFMALVVLGGPLALVPLVMIGVYALLIFSMRARLRLTMFHAARTRSHAQTRHIELYEKLEALHLGGMSDAWREQFRDISAQGSLASFHSQYVSQILETIIYTLTTLAALCVIYLGVYRVWGGGMTGGALFASMIFFWRVIAPWQTLASNIPKLEQLYRSVQQIDRLMALDTERELSPALGRIAKLQGSLEFAKVGLRYSKDSDPVLVGLSLAARPGELLAIAGGNGSGKTTVLKMALGLYRPQAGAIYLDGRDLRQLDPVEMRKTIAYVPQIPELFGGSIAENLRLGNPFATDQQLWHALELADARQQVEKMPLKLSTPMLNSDVMHSHLLHRLVLARAYAKDARIMLIDEMPYAVLNSRTGAIFTEQLKLWRGEKTIFMVSHRDDHIAMADKALGLLGNGRAAVDAPEKVIRELREESFKERRKVS